MYPLLPRLSRGPRTRAAQGALPVAALPRHSVAILSLLPGHWGSGRPARMTGALAYSARLDWWKTGARPVLEGSAEPLTTM